MADHEGNHYNHQIFLFGIATSLMVSSYLVMQHLQFRKLIHFFPKELLIAMLYTAGIWGIPIIYTTTGIHFQSWICIFSFFLLVLINVLIYSIYEEQDDRNDGYNSLAISYYGIFVRRLNFLLVCLSMILNMYLIIDGENAFLNMSGAIFLS